MLDTVHILLSEKWKSILEVQNSYTLSENMKDMLEQSLALAYVLYLYESYRLHISDQRLGDLEGGKPLEGGEICCY